MKRSTWRILAFGALLGVAALPASAQVVVGGAGNPSVEVNWSVLDSLGRQPTLADMLKSEPPVERRVAPAAPPKSQGVQYRPYKAGAKPYAKPTKPAKAQPAKIGAKPAKKSSVLPAAAKSEHMAELVQSARPAAPAPVAKLPEPKPEPKAAEVKPVEVPRASAQPPVPPKPQLTPMVEAPRPAAPTPAIIGPQIALPELPKPAAAPMPAPAPLQLAKAEEPAKVEAPKAEPAPLPPTSLTPPPTPVAKVEPKPEPAPQLAALPPAPAAAPAALKGDTLTIPFAVESARLPDAIHSDLDRLAKRMQKDEALALQLLAYADGDEANASKARRLSLSRALEVRKYLMDQGLRSTRIEVRALGNKLESGGSPDRVDAVLVSR